MISSSASTTPTIVNGFELDKSLMRVMKPHQIEACIFLFERFSGQPRRDNNGDAAEFLDMFQFQSSPHDPSSSDNVERSCKTKSSDCTSWLDNEDEDFEDIIQNQRSSIRSVKYEDDDNEDDFLRKEKNKRSEISSSRSIMSPSPHLFTGAILADEVMISFKSKCRL